jgi:Putative phage serine protease XkdF
MELKRAAEEQQMVWAEVYAPNIPDADGDIMTEEAIEQMAYKFMRERKTDRIDLQHNNKLVNAYIIESFIARKGDPDFIKGSWVVGMHIPDKGVWSMIKKGEINGYSMEALVTREKATMTVEIPPVISGRVAKADDGHDHEFFVSYDDNGQFLGGRTSSAADGHSHVIKRGTVTEASLGHNHRFSYVEKVLWEEATP